MALYALGDLHLSFQTDKSMDRFGAVWKDHEKKIEQNVCERVREEDTLVLTGGSFLGEEGCLNVRKILLLSNDCQAARFCCAGITICFGVSIKPLL